VFTDRAGALGIVDQTAGHDVRPGFEAPDELSRVTLKALP
jgi:hypothetical protein